MYTFQKDVAQSDDQLPRQPLVLVLDNSEAMGMAGKIDLINETLESLKSYLTSGDFTKFDTEICLITFGKDVIVEQEFVKINDFKPPALSSQGPSLTGSGLLRATAALTRRMAEFDKERINYINPQIFLFAGSKPDDMQHGTSMCNDVKSTILDGYINRKYTFRPVLISPPDSDSDTDINKTNNMDSSDTSQENRDIHYVELIKGIIPDNRPPLYLDNSMKVDNLISDIASDLYNKNSPYKNHKLTNDNTNEEEFNKKSESLCIIGASTIGPLHVFKGIPCQDAFAYKILSSDAGVIAIADGLGSASKSDIGARMAVDASINTISKVLKDQKIEDLDLSDIARESIFFAREVLEEQAEKLQCELKDLACTLIVALIHKDTAVVAHIGDGAVIIETKDGLKLLSEPGESEYANEVSPLTGTNWEQSLRITDIVSEISGMIAITDGCHKAALIKTQDEFSAFGGFCTPLLKYVKNIKSSTKGRTDIMSLLMSDKLCDNSDDDKTLVIAIINHA